MNMSSILSDKELYEELRAKVKSGASHPDFPIPDTDAAIVKIDRMSLGETLPHDPSLEAIIRTTGRPALLVQNSTFATPSSDTWKGRLETARNLLEKTIPSVGRIEVKNHDNKDWIGSAWVVADGIVVTNRHVAIEFAERKSDGKFEFLLNAEQKIIQPRIDLREEYRQPDEREFQVTRVLYIEESSGPDLAFLEVKFSDTSTAPPQPIPLADDVTSGDDVVVIGYPAWDGGRNDPAVMKDVFGHIYNVKRMMPGQILTVSDYRITHDCSTLGGVSGSPVVDINTGQVVGLHFAGKYKDENSAVPSRIVQDRLSKLIDGSL